jgi:hypothetical protein
MTYTKSKIAIYSTIAIIATVIAVPTVLQESYACSGDDCEVMQFKLGYKSPCANSGLWSYVTCTTWEEVWNDVKVGETKPLLMDVDSDDRWVKPIIQSKFKYTNPVYATWGGEWFMTDAYGNTLNTDDISKNRLYSHGRSVVDVLSDDKTYGDVTTISALITVYGIAS